MIPEMRYPGTIQGAFAPRPRGGFFLAFGQFVVVSNRRKLPHFWQQVLDHFDLKTYMRP